MIPYRAGLRHTSEVSQVSVVNKYSKAPNLYKERELKLTFPPSYLQQWYVLKSIVGRKTKHCPDPSETVDNYINHEFPHKIEAIKLDLITSEKEAQREIVFTVQKICTHSSPSWANS